MAHNGGPSLDGGLDGHMVGFSGGHIAILTQGGGDDRWNAVHLGAGDDDGGAVDFTSEPIVGLEAAMQWLFDAGFPIGCTDWREVPELPTLVAATLMIARMRAEAAAGPSPAAHHAGGLGPAVS